MLTMTVTFADVYGAIYFYSYFLISLVIIFGAYHFSSKVQLYNKSYRILNEIESKLGKIRLAIKGLEKKTDPATPVEKLAGVDCIDVICQPWVSIF